MHIECVDNDVIRVYSLSQTLSVPILDVDKKIKSMQMFRKPVSKAIQVADIPHGYS